MDTLNSNPAENASAPEFVPAPKAPAPAPAPAPAAPMEIPKTTGKTPGGWNRFAGYDPNAAKNKERGGRGGSGRR